MIVGHGLIATAFKHSQFDSAHYVVFASGVSNSMERDPMEYIREVDLLDQYIAKNKTLIYFSTTSIFDPTRQDSAYIRHKLNMEHRIAEQTSSYLILRLPILVGRTTNPNTLINYLVSAILEKRKISLHTKACRHLLDIDDLVPTLARLEMPNDYRNVINIPGSEKITVPDLVSRLESVLQTKGVFTWIEEGACYDLPSDAGEIIYIDRANYIDNMIDKYYGSR